MATSSTTGRANPLSAAPDDNDQQEDGRRLRRERNRAAVIEAMVALYDEGNLAPSSDEIAERAGLSPRSLFRYFEDIDDLVQAAIARQQQRIAPFLVLEIDHRQSFDARVAAFVKQRLGLLDAMGAVAQVARLRAPFQPLVQRELRQIRTHLRGQLETRFARELAALETSRASAAVAALDVLCSFESYRLMRDDQGLSRGRVAAALTESLVQMLSPRLTEASR